MSPEHQALLKRNAHATRRAKANTKDMFLELSDSRFSL
jgi:hypothetical protein